MTQKEIILAEEAEYVSETFADCIKAEEYTLFYFDKCKELWEGNHAIIYPNKIKDLSNVLVEIKDFYAKQQKEAAIFHPMADEYYHYFEENKEIIEKCGYEITLNDDYKFMTLIGENKIDPSNLLDIKLLEHWDERIATDIILQSEEYWELESTKVFSSRKNENNLLFVGYIGDKAIIYSIIHKSYNYDCVRFNYILCAKNHQGKGYGSEMISHITNFCRNKGYSNCYQWAGPSESIVRKAGFLDVFTARSGRINAKLKL